MLIGPPRFEELREIGYYTHHEEIKNIVGDYPVLYFEFKIRAYNIDSSELILLYQVITLEENDYVLTESDIEFDYKDEIQAITNIKKYYLSKVNILDIQFFEDINVNIHYRPYKKEFDKIKRLLWTNFMRRWSTFLESPNGLPESLRLSIGKSSKKMKDLEEIDEILWENQDAKRRMIIKIGDKYKYVQISFMVEDVEMVDISVLITINFFIKIKILEYL